MSWTSSNVLRLCSWRRGPARPFSKMSLSGLTPLCPEAWAPLSLLWSGSCPWTEASVAKDTGHPTYQGPRIPGVHDRKCTLRACMDLAQAPPPPDGQHCHGAFVCGECFWNARGQGGCVRSRVELGWAGEGDSVVWVGSWFPYASTSWWFLQEVLEFLFYF